MSLRQVHLRKLLRIFYLSPSRRDSLLRDDIRQDIAKEASDAPGGGDFYGPFWHDAKEHALGRLDLHSCVSDRVGSNPGRSNLYPQLRDGFLLWWEEGRRWTNEPFREVPAPKARYAFRDLNAAVKVENFLSVQDGSGDNHFIYPYFSPEPILQDEAARLGLWLIGRAIPTINWEEVRILDVLRGKTFSTDRTPLRGNEEDLFLKKYMTALVRSDELRREYEI